MERITTIAALRAALGGHRAIGHRIGFVPTLGALHEGHLANVRLAAVHADVVVVSVFVNPTQFDRPDDLAAYPRDLDGDEAALLGLGAATPTYVFAPTVEEMYPRPLLTTVHVRSLTDRLCGATRPGHFDGVATVVTKLLDIVQPHVAVFGRKDFQQLQVIRRLVADLDLPVTIVAAPTVREDDGVAMSSRNRRLTPPERLAARSLSQGLRAAVETARRDRAAGRPVVAGVLREAVAATLAAAPEVDVDYVEVVDPETLAPPDDDRGEDAGPGRPATGGGDHLLAAVAAFVGPVRLIDNVEIGDDDDEDRLLRATGEARG
jgi:pantoate--beta-alanine ligase